MELNLSYTTVRSRSKIVVQCCDMLRGRLLDLISNLSHCIIDEDGADYQLERSASVVYGNKCVYKLPCADFLHGGILIGLSVVNTESDFLVANDSLCSRMLVMGDVQCQYYQRRDYLPGRDGFGAAGIKD